MPKIKGTINIHPNDPPPPPPEFFFDDAVADEAGTEETEEEEDSAELVATELIDDELLISSSITANKLLLPVASWDSSQIIIPEPSAMASWVFCLMVGIPL